MSNYPKTIKFNFGQPETQPKPTPKPSLSNRTFKIENTWYEVLAQSLDSEIVNTWEKAIACKRAQQDIILSYVAQNSELYDPIPCRLTGQIIGSILKSDSVPTGVSSAIMVQSTGNVSQLLETDPVGYITYQISYMLNTHMTKQIVQALARKRGIAPQQIGQISSLLLIEYILSDMHKFYKNLTKTFTAIDGTMSYAYWRILSNIMAEILSRKKTGTIMLPQFQAFCKKLYELRSVTPENIESSLDELIKQLTDGQARFHKRVIITDQKIRGALIGSESYTPSIAGWEQGFMSACSLAKTRASEATALASLETYDRAQAELRKELSITSLASPIKSKKRKTLWELNAKARRAAKAPRQSESARKTKANAAKFFSNIDL